MPIRFRCGHCHQLLGIARRKAGTVVVCPSCQQAVVVPTTDEADALAGMTKGPVSREGDRSKKVSPPASTEAPPGGFVFERSDFDELFRPVIDPAGMKNSKRTKEPVTEPIAPAVASPGSGHEKSPNLAPAHSGESAVTTVAPGQLRFSAGDIVLTPHKALMLAALAVGGMIFAFGGGLLMGMYFLPR